MTFPRYPHTQLLAAECSDFALIQDELCPCAWPIWIVSVFHRGKDSAQPPMRDIEACGNHLQCSQGEWWWEADCLWEGPYSAKETHPRRTEMPNTREVAPDTPEDPSRSAVLWINSVHRVSNQWEPSCQYYSFLSTPTMGPEHEPSPIKGRDTTYDIYIHIKDPSLNRNISKVRIPSVFKKILKPSRQLELPHSFYPPTQGGTFSTWSFNTKDN